MRIRFRPLPVLAALLCLTTQVMAEITVATAANMQYAMKEIIDIYQKKTGKEVKPVFASSGKLVAQILNGAPYDVFVSADMDFADSLFSKGYATSKAKEYAGGVLVLWTLNDLDLSKGFAILKDPVVKTLAIGDPKVTVYGPAALSALTKSGMLEEVKPKIVYGENINTVAQYIVNRSVDIGFANLSYTQSGPMAGKGKWIRVDRNLYDPLPQGAVVLRYGADNNPKESKAFYDFLYGPESRQVLEKHGYILP